MDAITRWMDTVDPERLVLFGCKVLAVFGACALLVALLLG